MSDTNSAMMETTPSLLETALSSDLGNNHLYIYSSTNASSYNYPSTAASIASSDVEYQHDLTNSSSTLPLSRPLSRTSTTSCMSITLYKDGVEGKRIHRSGIPSYPYNLIATMIDNRHIKSPMAQYSTLTSNNGAGSDDSSIASKGTDSNDKDSIDIPSGPPVSLNEKMKLLKTGQVQKDHHHVNPNGPSVGPIVFEDGSENPEFLTTRNVQDDSDDVSMSDYVRFQKEAAREYDKK